MVLPKRKETVWGAGIAQDKTKVDERRTHKKKKKEEQGANH